MKALTEKELQDVTRDLEIWSRELGFAAIGITDTDPGRHETALQQWLAHGYHGEMDYMARHGSKRSRPDELEPGTIRVICVRMNYWPEAADAEAVLENGEQAYLSRYATGRDYHKVMRQRLKQLGERLQNRIAESHYRVFVDSAPVLERGFAQKAGLGWIGKNTMLIHPQAGSYFFLGELFTNLPLPISQPFDSQHCGSCSACLELCPTRAFVAPHVLDARRCISYLTIELKGAIPEELRPLMGNRVFGCDDCQIVCPWNKFTQLTDEKDFTPRHQLDTAELITLFNWTEAEFLKKTEGSPIRRSGYEGWLRNLAVGLGNAPASAKVIKALEARLAYPSELVREHVEWALARHRQEAATMQNTPSRDTLKSKLNLETSTIPWRELQTYYARGHVVQVSPQLDLLEVACELADDNASRLKSWMSNGLVGEVSASDARRYYDDDTLLWAVVLMPWVLVQKKEQGGSATGNPAPC